MPFQLDKPQEPGSEADQRAITRADLLIAGGLALVAVAVYLPALKVGYFSDDFYFLGRNSPILERPTYLFHIHYRDFIPVVHASFLLDWLIARDWAPLSHLSSLLFHGICTALVFFVCRRLSCAVPTAAAATLLFAFNVHISEPVIWAAARGHSLATLFLVACVFALSRSRMKTAVVLFLLALGCKETALFPVVVMPFAWPERRHWWRVAAVFAPIAVAFAVFNVLAKPSFYLAEAGLFDFILQAPFLLLRPVGLASFYDFSPVSAAAVFFGFAGLGVLLRKSAAGLLGLAWIAASLVPIIPQPVITSRYFYMVAVGYALLAAGLVETVAPRLASRRALRAAQVCATTLLVLLVVANVSFIQREIGDYRLLSAPYEACTAAIRPHLEALAPGDTLVVLDVGPRATVAELGRRLAERGNINKLVPSRPDGVDGAVELTDMANIVWPRSPGHLASVPEPPYGDRTRVVIFDGSKAHPIVELSGHELPPERVFAVTWGDAERFFAQRIRF